jgi:hypothetical protein
VAGHFAFGPFGFLNRMKLTLEFSLRRLLVQKSVLGAVKTTLAGTSTRLPEIFLTVYTTSS